MKRFSFSSAILASILATLIMTVFMMYFGMDTMQSLGFMAGKTGAMAYVVGGFIHLLVGIIYGLIYALFFRPWMSKLPGFFAGALYSLFPFILAITLMGQFQAIIQSIFKSDKMLSENCMPSSPVSSCTQGCTPGQGKTTTTPAPVPSPSRQAMPCEACAPCMPTEGCGAETPCNSSPTAYKGKNSKSYCKVGDSRSKNRKQSNKQAAAAISAPSNKGKSRYAKNSFETTMHFSIEEADKFFALVGQGCTPCPPKMAPKSEVPTSKMTQVFQEEVKEGQERKDKLGFAPVLWTLFNHLVYGFFLGLFYRQKKQKTE